MLRILDTGISSAQENMQIDENLLQSLDPQGEPILHLYRWANPSATYGYFIAPEKHLDLEGAKKRGIQLAKRPTGGGILFHIWDLAFSFLMPVSHPQFSSEPLENYKFVNEIVLDTVREFLSLPDAVGLIDASLPSSTQECQNFCMAKPTQYDVLYRGMKIAGAAQRKTKQGYLHQGTISLSLPQIDLLSEVLLNKKEILEAMFLYTFAPLGLVEGKKLERARREVEQILSQKFMAKL